MLPKTYIIILMVIIALILTFHANIFGKNKEFLDAKTNIIKPDNVNIENLDIKQLKNIFSKQTELINKQSTVINNFIEKTDKSNDENNKKFNKNIIKPDENIEKYFENIRQINDTIIKKNQENDENNDNNDNLNIGDRYKITMVKTYLEDPIMRGGNIFESEQYSKLLEIGNIQIDNKNTPPNPMHFSRSFQKTN